MNIFKTIKLGTVKKLQKELEKNNINIGDYAKKILAKVDISKHETTIDLVVKSVEELGFKNGATLKEIYAKAKEIGLKLCPAEVGPQLRLQYLDQPRNEWLFIAMNPITDSGRDPSVFHLGRGSAGLWLRAYWGNPDYRWRADDRWVFSRGKSSTKDFEYLPKPLESLSLEIKEVTLNGKTYRLVNEA